MLSQLIADLVAPFDGALARVVATPTRRPVPHLSHAVGVCRSQPLPASGRERRPRRSGSTVPIGAIPWAPGKSGA